MLLSILIPVFNAEKYIEETISSVVSQRFSDYEIIMYDDGSTDDSLKKCRTLESKYPEIISVMHGSNCGVLETRRKLINLAKGDYIWFVDADDSLVPKALQILSNTIHQYSPELILFDLVKKNPDQTEELFTLPLESKEVWFDKNEKNVLFNLLLTTKYLNSLCTKVFKKNLMEAEKNLKHYLDVKIGEDAYMTYPILDEAKRIMYLKTPLYLYQKRDASITRTIDVNRINSYLYLFEREDIYIQKWGIDERVKNEVVGKRIDVICFYIQEAFKEAKRIKKKSYFADYLDKLVKQPVIGALNRKCNNSTIPWFHKVCMNLFLNNKKVLLYYLLEAYAFWRC